MKIKQTHLIKCFIPLCFTLCRFLKLGIWSFAGFKSFLWFFEYLVKIHISKREITLSCFHKVVSPTENSAVGYQFYFTTVSWRRLFTLSTLEKQLVIGTFFRSNYWSDRNQFAVGVIWKLNFPQCGKSFRWKTFGAQTCLIGDQENGRDHWRFDCQEMS